MKRKLLCLALAASCSISAQAATFIDFDRIVVDLNEYNRSYSSTFNIKTEDVGIDTYGPNWGDHGPAWFRSVAGSAVGYVPDPLCTITSAIVTFGFWADDYAKEQLQVSFNNGPLSSPFPQDTQVNQYEIFSFVIGDSALADLQANGTLNYSASLLEIGQSRWWDTNYDNVWFKWAKLEVTTECRPPQQVPDAGATAALLGATLLGLVAIRRKTA